MRERGSETPGEARAGPAFSPCSVRAGNATARCPLRLCFRSQHVRGASAHWQHHRNNRCGLGTGASLEKERKASIHLWPWKGWASFETRFKQQSLSPSKLRASHIFSEGAAGRPLPPPSLPLTILRVFIHFSCFVTFRTGST